MAALRAAVFPLSAKNRRGGHVLPPPPLPSARVKATLDLFSRNWGYQDGTWYPKWRFATNVAHCDKHGACEFVVLTCITLLSLVQIGPHMLKNGTCAAWQRMAGGATLYAHVLMAR